VNAPASSRPRRDPGPGPTTPTRRAPGERRPARLTAALVVACLGLAAGPGFAAAAPSPDPAPSPAAAPAASPGSPQPDAAPAASRSAPIRSAPAPVRPAPAPVRAVVRGAPVRSTSPPAVARPVATRVRSTARSTAAAPAPRRASRPARHPASAPATRSPKPVASPARPARRTVAKKRHHATRDAAPRPLAWRLTAAVPRSLSDLADTAQLSARRSLDDGTLRLAGAGLMMLVVASLALLNLLRRLRPDLRRW
jgi:hypothetical protein